MANFKEYLEQDLNNVFFNLNEFAEEHIINGKKHSITVDNDRLKERSKKEFDGISVGELLYFVKEADYGPRPAVDSIQVFDGRQMYVFDARTDMGMHEVILTQNRGV